MILDKPWSDRSQLEDKFDNLLADARRMEKALHNIMLRGTTSQGNTLEASIAYEGIKDFNEKWNNND